MSLRLWKFSANSDFQSVSMSKSAYDMQTYTGWSTQRVHRYISQNMHCTKKCYIQKLHGLKGYTLLCINFFYRWRRFGDLKVNFVFLNRILYFLYQNMVEYRIVSKKVLTFISPKPNS